MNEQDLTRIISTNFGRVMELFRLRDDHRDEKPIPYDDLYRIQREFEADLSRIIHEKQLKELDIVEAALPEKSKKSKDLIQNRRYTIKDELIANTKKAFILKEPVVDEGTPLRDENDMSTQLLPEVDRDKHRTIYKLKYDDSPRDERNKDIK